MKLFHACINAFFARSNVGTQQSGPSKRRRASSSEWSVAAIAARLADERRAREVLTEQSEEQAEELVEEPAWAVDTDAEWLRGGPATVPHVFRGRSVWSIRNRFGPDIPMAVLTLVAAA